MFRKNEKSNRPSRWGLFLHNPEKPRPDNSLGDRDRSIVNPPTATTQAAPEDSEKPNTNYRSATSTDVRPPQTEPKKKTSGKRVEFPEYEPWPEPVDGAEVLDAVAETFQRYLVLPQKAEAVLALWVAHTHLFEAFSHTPRLNITAPEKGCGKTLLLDVLQTLTPRPLRTESVTTAVLFRLIDEYSPTLLIDEYDTFLRDKEELRGALNAGHKRGGQHLRCIGDSNEVRGFKTFAPVALAGIRELPSTLQDRSIILHMTRAKPSEKRARFDARFTGSERILARQLARWATDNIDCISEIDPELPSLYNREADNWRPLAAIAEAIGHGWPEKLVGAISQLRHRDDETSVSSQLLADIHWLFEEQKCDRLASNNICTLLERMEDRPWADWHHGKPISPRHLADLLRPFRIVPTTTRFGEKTAKGYTAQQFSDAWERYLPRQEP